MRVILLMLIGFSCLSLADFSKNNGVVIDSSTKLEWQDNYSSNGGYIKRSTWREAINYCESLSLGGKKWRLPNLRELASLVEDTKYNPSIDSSFEAISSYVYWSSTTIIYKDYAWTVSFNDGTIHHYNSKNHYYYVRCVSAGE